MRMCYFFLVFLVLSLSLIDNSKLSTLFDYYVYSLGIKPLFWLVIAFIVAFFLPKNRQAGKLKYSGQFSLWALNCALIYIGALIFTGLFTGFGNSPYDHSIVGIILNIFSIGAVLVSIEFIRSYLVNGLVRKEKYLVFLFITLLMTIPQLKFANIIQISDWIELSMWICEDFGPKFCLGLLATYLCFLGGPIPAIVFMSMTTGFHWISPILPDSPWLVKGLVGIMVPVFQMTFLSGLYLKMNKSIKEYKAPKENFLGWIATCMATIMMLWFVIGVFPVFPAVIATGSMEPVIYPGDLILVDKIKTIDQVEGLEVGDIIQFKKGDMMICHRITGIIDDKGVLSFITKGDNNPTIDSMPVAVENLRGSIIKVVPKLGWPSLIFKFVDSDPVEI